jgi:hypothetical protein
VHSTYAYNGLAPLTSFADAITRAKPQIIVPGDDLATWHLHHLHSREQRSASGGTLCALIERSLGAHESFPIVYSRSSFIELARAEGVRAPKAGVIRNTDDLRTWVARMGFPTVLKANGTSGGDGVRIVHQLDEAERALRELLAPPLLARAAKRALLDRDQTLVWPSLLRRRSVVNAQAFVLGHEATSTIACWKGSVLASLHFEVVKKASPAGHATVVRLMDCEEMSVAVEKMTRRLSLSGLYGFDFMIEAGTGNAYIIEINPRATQVGHLSLGPGRDLPAALYAALSGKAVQAAPKVTGEDTIALFPQEWIRDPQSPFLQSGYHDVPWDEPEFVRDCVSNRKKQTAWYPRSSRKQASPAATGPKPTGAAAKNHAIGLDWSIK